MCPQTPRLSPEYSHKAGLQTVITGMPLQLRPVTRSGHAGPVIMGRITRGPPCWTRQHGGMTSSYGAKGVPARCLVSVGPTTTAKASSEGWRLRLRPNSSILLLVSFFSAIVVRRYYCSINHYPGVFGYTPLKFSLCPIECLNLRFGY
jgi:hypothetical protein